MSAGAIPTFAEFSHSLEPPQATQAQPTQKIPTFAQFAQDEGEDNSDTITPQQANAFKGDPFDGLKATTPQAPPAYTGPKNLGAILTRVPPSPTHGGPGYGPNDIPKPAPMPGTPNERMRQAVSEGLNMHPDLPMPDNTGVVSGVTRGLEKTVQGALTPGNAALAIGTAGAGPIIQRLVAGGFSLQMLTEAYNKVPEVKAAIDSGDYGKAAEVATEAIGTLVMGAAAGKHALTAPKPLTSARDFGLQEGNAEPVAAAEMPDAFNAQPRPTPGMPAPPTQAPKLSTEELTAKIRDIAATRGSFGVPFLQRETGATYAEIQPILDQFVQDKTLAQAKNARGRVYHISRESRGPSVEAAATHTPPEVASPAAVAAPEPKAAPQEEPHEFSSTQVNLPPELHAAHAAATAAIPDSELAEDGRETEPHITAKFGLKADTPDAIREAVRGEGPITAKLGKASIFDNPKFDVLKLDVDSPDLHRINGKLAELPNGDEHPDYTPHVTLAYLKKGEGAKYVGKKIPGLTGQNVTFNSLDFSGKDRMHTPIPLEGKNSIEGEMKTSNAVGQRPISGSENSGFPSDIVEPPMVSEAQDLKVLDPIVRAIPVNVVDFLGGKENTAKVLLHDPSVLRNALAASNDPNISADLTALLSVIADTRAKLPPSLGSGSSKYFSALDAFESDLRKSNIGSRLPKTTGLADLQKDSLTSTPLGTEQFMAFQNSALNGHELVPADLTDSLKSHDSILRQTETGNPLRIPASSEALPPRARRKRQRGSFSNKAIASPSYDQTRKSFIDNLGLEGDEKSAFEKSVSEWEKKNPEREVVSFQDVRDEAKKYGPEVVSQLTRPEANETMDPAVRQAARDALAGISAKVDELTKQFGSMNKDVDTTAYLETAGKIDALRKQQDNLIDVLIPTRSQDGRNLVYWRMAAQKSFDPIYWLARATKEAGGALPPATRGKLTEILERGRRAQAEGGTANVVRQDLAQEMSKIQKSTPWETITALRKMGLMGVKTHLRNIGGNLGFQLLEETQRIPASMIDMALSLASGERTVEGMSPDSFSKATYAAATRGAREFVETLKHGTPLDQLGKSELHRELNSGNKLVDAWVNYNSRMLSAEDRLFKVYAFERSLQEQQKLTGITEPTDTMRARAIADAEYATFNNRNVLSTAWNSGISQLNKGGVTGKAAALVAETTVPFVRTPTNILARLIDYTPPGAAVRVGYQAIKAAVDREFTPEAQRAISNGIGRGLTGSALIYMGYQMAKAGKATGAAQYDAGARNVDEAAGRVPGSILIGDKWRQINQFSPEGGLFTLGATLERESTRGLKNELKRPQNMLKIATDTVMQQPMLEGTNQLIESIQQPGKKLDNFVGSTAGSFVPTLAAEAATAGDTKRRDIHAEGLLDSVVKAAQMRVPGWRNQLPARKDVFGKEEPQNRASAVDPTIGSTAKETSDPVIKELIDRGLKLSKITEPKATSVQNVRGHEITKGFNETPEEMQLRNDIEGALIYRVLSRVTQAPGYKALPTDANDDTRRLALERAVSRVRNPGPESGGINLNRLVNSAGWGHLPVEQRVQRLQSILRRIQ